MFAHSSCTFLLLLFIKSTVYCLAHVFSLHILFYYFLFSTSLIFLYLCIFFVFVFHIIARSMERT